MSRALDRPPRIAGFIPLKSSARAYIAAVCHWSNVFHVPARFHYSGEDATTIRETILSLFPDGMAPSDENLVIHEEPLTEVASTVAGSMEADLLIIGPTTGKDQSWGFQKGLLRPLAQESATSFLFLKECPLHGFRYRRIVCEVGYDASALELVKLAHHVAHDAYATSLCLVREVSDDEDREECLADLRAFLGPSAEPQGNYDMELGTVPGRFDEAILNFAAFQNAQLLLLLAPEENAPVWQCIDGSLENPIFSNQPCSMLLYRPVRGAV